MPETECGACRKTRYTACSEPADIQKLHCPYCGASGARAKVLTRRSGVKHVTSGVNLMEGSLQVNGVAIGEFAWPSRSTVHKLRAVGGPPTINQLRARDFLNPVPGPEGPDEDVFSPEIDRAIKWVFIILGILSVFYMGGQIIRALIQS